MSKKELRLRDEFAMSAMNALLQTCPRGFEFGVNFKENNLNYALASYAIADAMLAVRANDE